MQGSFLPVISIKPIQVWEVNFGEKPKRFEKAAKKSKLLYSEGHNFMCKKSLGVATHK